MKMKNLRGTLILLLFIQIVLATVNQNVYETRDVNYGASVGVGGKAGGSAGGDTGGSVGGDAGGSVGGNAGGSVGVGGGVDIGGKAGGRVGCKAGGSIGVSGKADGSIGGKAGGSIGIGGNIGLGGGKKKCGNGKDRENNINLQVQAGNSGKNDAEVNANIDIGNGGDYEDCGCEDEKEEPEVPACNEILSSYTLKFKFTGLSKVFGDKYAPTSQMGEYVKQFTEDTVNSTVQKTDDGYDVYLQLHRQLRDFPVFVLGIVFPNNKPYKKYDYIKVSIKNGTKTVFTRRVTAPFTEGMYVQDFTLLTYNTLTNFTEVLMPLVRDDSIKATATFVIENYDCQPIDSDNGVLDWTLKPNETKILSNFNYYKDAFIRSPYFYTSPQGYRVQGLFGKFPWDKSVGFGVVLLKGKYDAKLPPYPNMLLNTVIFDQSDIPEKKNIESSKGYSTNRGTYILSNTRKNPFAGNPSQYVASDGTAVIRYSIKVR